MQEELHTDRRKLSAAGLSNLQAASPSTAFQVSDVPMPPIPQIYVINPLEDARWIDFSLGHPKANVFHSVGWLTTLQKTYGYQPVAYTSSAPGAPLTNSIVFCQVRSWITGPRLVSLPFSDH